MNLKTNFLTQIQINQILKQILELNFVTRSQKQISNTTPKKKELLFNFIFPQFPKQVVPSSLPNETKRKQHEFLYKKT